MAHNISGIITSFTYKGNLPNIVLDGNFHLLPVESYNGRASRVKIIAPYENLTPEIRETIKKISFSGACAYIETAYFGGIGTQISETWENGLKIEGPLISYDGIESKMEYQDVTLVDCSINQSLKILGVLCQEGKDEFDTVGLGRYRSNRKIIQEYKSKF